MAYTTIDKPSDYFDTKLHTGTGGSKTLAYDFEVDFYWTKMRNDVYPHNLFDSSRGNNALLRANQTNSEVSAANTVSFGNASGVTLGSDGSSYGVNQANNDSGSSATFVGFAWKAGGGSRTTFTESGNNPGGGYQANTTAGFSIVDFVGTGANGTVQHGLGVAPRWYIVKNRDRSANWQVYHEDNGNTHYVKLNTTGAKLDNHEIFNDTSPTSSVFSVGIDQSVNFNGEDHIAYVFAEIQGYSKFGSYTGIGNENGPFVYTGFKPAWLMIKRTEGSGYWVMLDNKRNTPNGTGKRLGSNATDAEYGSTNVDILSNGFKVRASNSDSDTNLDGGSYIYMAFAEHPFVSSKGVPVTAR